MRIIALFMLIFLLSTGTAIAGKSREEKLSDYGRYFPTLNAAVLLIENNDVDGSLQLATGLLGTQILTMMLKHATHVRRPDDRNSFKSFPSGHSSVAFAAAAFIHRRYNFWDAIPAYAVASYVAFSRVNLNRHRTSEVVVGALLGIGVNWLLIEPFKHATNHSDSDAAFDRAPYYLEVNTGSAKINSLHDLRTQDDAWSLNFHAGCIKDLFGADLQFSYLQGGVKNTHQDIKSKLIMLNAYYYIGQFFNKFSPFASIGVGAARVELFKHKTVFAAQGSAGILYQINRFLAATLFYRYLSTGNVYHGEKLSAHQLNFGLRITPKSTR